MAKFFRRQWHEIVISKSYKGLLQLSDAEKRQRRNYWLSDSLASFLACLFLRELPLAAFLTKPVPTTLTTLTNILFIYFLVLSFLTPVLLILSRCRRIRDGTFFITALLQTIINPSLFDAAVLIASTSVIGILVATGDRAIFVIFSIFFLLYIISGSIMIKWTKDSIIKGLILAVIVLLAFSIYVLVDTYLINSGLAPLIQAITIVSLALILLIVAFVLIFLRPKKKN